MEREFIDELYKYYNERKEKVLLPKEKLLEIIECLQRIETDENYKKSRDDYYYIGGYDTLKLGELTKLIRKRKTDAKEIKYFVSIEETYDIIKKTHLALKHAGRDKMQKEINRKYANITVNCINLYKSLCGECQLRRNPSKGVVVKPIVSKDFNSRGQVDLIDMQSMPDGNSRFIMNCDICDVCSRGMQITREWHLSHGNLERQANKMVARNNQVLQPVTVGSNVTLPVPSVDRGRGDPRNLMCVVTDLNIETQQYKLGN